MPATTGNIQGYLKTVFSRDYIKAQENKSAYWWSKHLSKAPDKPTGKGFAFGIHTSGNMAGGVFTENDALNQAQHEVGLTATVLPKEYHWPIEITGKAMAIAERNIDSFVGVAVFEMREALKSLLKELNQDFYRDGLSVRTDVVAVVTASDIVPVREFQMLRVNSRLDIWDSSLTLKKEANVKVISRAPAAGTIRLDRAVTLVVGDVFVRVGAADGAPPEGKSLGGLRLMIDTTTVASSYLGVDRNLNSEWQSNLFDAGGVPVSNDMLQRLDDRLHYISENPDGADYLLSTPRQRRQYLGIATPLKRFTDDNLDTGYKTLEWNGKAWEVDTDAPEGDLFYLSSGDIQKFLVQDVHLDATTGDTMKWIPYRHRFFLYYYFLGNVACRRPNSHLRAFNLPVPPF